MCDDDDRLPVSVLGESVFLHVHWYPSKCTYTPIRRHTVAVSVIPPPPPRVNTCRLILGIYAHRIQSILRCFVLCVYIFRWIQHSILHMFVYCWRNSTYTYVVCYCYALHTSVNSVRARVAVMCLNQCARTERHCVRMSFKYLVGEASVCVLRWHSNGAGKHSAQRSI